MESSSFDKRQVMDFVLALVLREASGGIGNLKEVEEKFPHVPNEEISRAFLSAGEIVSAAYETGVAVTNGSLSKPAAIVKLESKFPGYGKKSYEAVVEYGCRLSR